MTVNVVVMGQFYGGEYLLEVFWGCCTILGALNRYCRNEDGIAYFEKAFCSMLDVCAVVLYFLT